MSRPTPDDQGQDDHEHRDRPEAVAEAAVPRRDDDRGDHCVATPPDDRWDRFDAIGRRGECQQQPDDGRRVGERREADDHHAERHSRSPARDPGPDP
jgi:hypothetical protein